MIINTKLILGTLALANVAANWPIGTAATTVDLYSSIQINQTTASIVATIPAPTVSQTWQVLRIGNVGTAPISVWTTLISVGWFADFQWSGTAWLYSDENDLWVRNFYLASPFIANTWLVVTHNFWLAASDLRKIAIQVRDVTTWHFVDLVPSAFTTNSVTLTSNSAIASWEIFVTRL